MSLIVTVCRTLASRPRLRLLRAIHAAPKITVSNLATAVAQSPDTVSHHLKLLCDFHFVRAVPCGRHVYYQPGPDLPAAHPFLRGVRHLLQEVCTATHPCRTPVQVCDKADAASWEAVFSALVELVTTYTHLRRLLILKHLTGTGACGAYELAEHVGMSPDATYRHLDKLKRRSVVASSGSTPELWFVRPHKGRNFHDQLLALVLQELRAK